MDGIFNEEDLTNFVNLLKTAKNESSIESYIYIKNLLKSIEFPLPIIIYPKGTKFIRSRVHNNNELFFESVEQISYRTDTQNIKNFGRANEPGQSIFYCSDNDMISFCETSYIAKKLINKDFEYITESIWISSENIYVVSLSYNEDILDKHLEVNNSAKSFDNILKKISSEETKVLKNLLNFLSKEFSQPADDKSNNYKITSAFANYIYETYRDLDGILYPSTIYTKEGYNFAFPPEVVNNKLNFHIARRIKVEKINKTKYTDTEKIEAFPNKNNNCIIDWPK